MPDLHKKDLVVLVADRNIEYAMKGLLSRSEAIDIREITYDIHVHPEHDTGCLLHGCEFLRPFVNGYLHALIIFDHDGCGQEIMIRTDLENDIERQLSGSGWDNRAAAIVIDPELEIWVWSDSPHVESILGWAGRQPDLRTWLGEKGYFAEEQIKPSQPKNAMETALRMVQKPRSSSIFLQLAQNVSVNRCRDQAFLKFKNTLRTWFPLST